MSRCRIAPVKGYVIRLAVMPADEILASNHPIVSENVRLRTLEIRATYCRFLGLRAPLKLSGLSVSEGQ